MNHTYLVASVGWLRHSAGLCHASSGIVVKSGRILLSILMLITAMSALSAQKISNIRSTLEPTCGYYTITFDLEGKANELYNLKLVPYLGNKEILEPKFASGSGLQTPTTEGKGLQVFWNPVLEGTGTGNWQFRISATLIPMIFVEGGCFMMGSNDGVSDEKPVHQLKVSSFLIGKYEVTQKEWVEVMGSNPSRWKGNNLPVEQVSWYQVVEYCNKRSLNEGLKPCYSGKGYGVSCDWSANGYRLPTEAEWEYAARGGNKSKGYKFSGSNDLGSVAWYDDNSDDQTKAVGTKQPNELGIHDMSGNVGEWCWDRYDSGYYGKSQNSDPSGPISGPGRVLRGGCMGLSFSYCRVADRLNLSPGDGVGASGIRVVRAMK